jgi:Domain of unknown function (DUF4157)
MRVAQHAVPVPAPPARAVQRKVRIGPVDDLLEHEADRVADAVVSGPGAVTVTGAPAGAAQRKCAECEKEGEGSSLQRTCADGAGARVAGSAAEAARTATAAGGAPLSAAERAYFEPRFARDFGDVRIHADGRAAQAAQAINARAYTLGSHIAFASGEFDSTSPTGRRLLAHELAHVVQQDGTFPTIRRAAYGSGTPPNFANRTLAVVPANEHARVDEAMAIVNDVVARPSAFSACHDQFATLCPGGNQGTLAATWQQVTIWRITTPGASENARGTVNGTDVAYTQNGFDQGAEGLAGTLLHESGHNCGIPGGATHWHAAKIRTYCIGPGRNDIQLSGGKYLGEESGVLMLSYRRFLGDFAAGRLRFTLGGDVNLLGAAGLLEQPTQRRPGEIGSVMAGAQFRIGGWGGSRYGGIGIRLEGGIGAGEFAARSPSADPSSSPTLGAGWVVQIGPRAEFLIRTDSAHVLPVTLSAALRYMQPRNEEARALNAIVGSVEFPF